MKREVGGREGGEREEEGRGGGERGSEGNKQKECERVGEEEQRKWRKEENGEGTPGSKEERCYFHLSVCVLLFVVLLHVLFLVFLLLLSYLM